jgi:hypothetical protein
LPRLTRRRDGLRRIAHRPSSPSTNYLIDVDNAIIVDVEATTAIRQAEVLAAKRMVERSMEHFDLYPERLIGDTAYGSAEMLDWLVHDRGIEPHIPVYDKSQRSDGTFSRDDFSYDQASDTYRCPAAKTLRRYRRPFTVPRSGPIKNNPVRYRASKHDCDACPFKPRCCPNTPARNVPRSIYEGCVTWPATWQKPRPTRPRAASEKRSRCCSPNSNAF